MDQRIDAGNNIFMQQAEPYNPEEIILPSTHFQNSDGHSSPHTAASLSNKKHIAASLNENIIHHIQDEIISSKITVSSSNRNPLIRAAPPAPSQSPKLHEIVKKRKELQEEIVRLQHEESRAKLQPHKTQDRKLRSEFTKEEHEHVAKALEAKRRLEEEIAIKNQLLQEEIEAKIKREEAERKAKMEELCRQKQQRIAEHLRQLQAKKEERERDIKEHNKIYQSVKGRTFLHEKMETFWRGQETKHQAEDKDILTERKKGKEFSMNSIIEHEKKYRTFIANNSKQKEEKLKQARLEKEMLEKQTLSHYQPSPFLQTIFEEEKQLKAAEQHRNDLIKSLLETKAKYGDNIREMNKQLFEKKRSLPPIKQAKQDETVQSNKDKSKQKAGSRASKSMSRLEIAEIGNKYLREVHSSIGQTEGRPKELKTISHRNAPPKLQKYQDYLQDLKRKRAEKPASPELREISELKFILRRGENAEDKLYRAKLIAGRLEDRAKDSTSLLVSSINAKLAILNQFSS